MPKDRYAVCIGFYSISCTRSIYPIGMADISCVCVCIRRWGERGGELREDFLFLDSADKIYHSLCLIDRSRGSPYFIDSARILVSCTPSAFRIIAVLAVVVVLLLLPSFLVVVHLYIEIGIIMVVVIAVAVVAATVAIAAVAVAAFNRVSDCCCYCICCYYWPRHARNEQD